jgi:hypothetical protein
VAQLPQEIQMIDAISEDFDFEILETSEATAMEEMGASSTICAGSTCTKASELAAEGAC